MSFFIIMACAIAQFACVVYLVYLLKQYSRRVKRQSEVIDHVIRENSELHELVGHMYDMEVALKDDLARINTQGE